MKSLLPILGLFIIVFWSSCETDFELEGDWKDIPVVYSYLSEQDTAHYVRVERAFLEPGGNAIDIAQIPDSIYYRAGEVVVKLTNGNNEVELTRVNGADEGYPRQDGDFATTPNILYKASKSALNLQGGDEFKVIISRADEITAEAVSTLVKPFTFSQLPPQGLNVGNYNSSNTIAWRPDGDEVSVFDVRLVFRYNETDPNNPGSRVTKEITWILDQDYSRDPDVSTQRFPFSGEAFFQFVGSSIDPIDNGNRQFEAIFFEVVGAGSEIAEYLGIANANIGLTSAQAVPVYSNVDGGVGIVSSRYKVRSTPLSLNSRARDSLLTGFYTNPLKFVP